MLKLLFDNAATKARPKSGEAPTGVLLVVVRKDSPLFPQEELKEIEITKSKRYVCC